MLALLLLACEAPPPTDPAEVAEIACQGMPGLSVDAAGRAWLRQVMDPEELAAWDESPYLGVAIHALGLDGYGVVRANLLCEVVEVGAEAVRVSREEPDLSQWTSRERREVYKLPRRTVELSFARVEVDGLPRVRVGALAAREALRAARAEAEAGQGEQALARLDALAEVFPDPMLRFEREAVQELLARDEALSRLALVVDEGLLFVENQGDAPLPEGPVELDCGGEALVEARPALAPGDRVALLTGPGDPDPAACALRRRLPWEAAL